MKEALQITEVDNDNIIVPAPKKLAIIQLSRLGDLVQTCISMEGLKTSNPDIQTTLFARKKFARPLMFILKDFFDEIILLPNLNEAKDTIDGHRLLLDSLNQVKNTTFNACINLSYSKSSGWLTTFLKSNYKLGLSYNTDGEVIIPDKWSQYIYSVVMRGTFNKINLVNIFQKIIGTNAEPRVITNPNNNYNRITINPFSSSEKKNWKPNKWVEIIFKIAKKHREKTVAIIGGKNDRHMAKVIEESPILAPFRSRINFHVGNTLQENSQIIKSSDLIISHDSLTAHMASFYKRPNIIISLGTVRVEETAPFLENSFLISPTTNCFPCFPNDQCSDYKCHADVSYQLVSEVIDRVLNETSMENVSFKDLPVFLTSSAQVFKTKFSSEGLLTTTSMTETTLKAKNLFGSLLRVATLFLHQNIEETIPFPRISRELHQDFLQTLLGLQHLYELAEFGKKYSRFILEEVTKTTPNLVEIKSYSTKIDEIDHLQNLLSKTYSLLIPVIEIHTVKKANLIGNNIVELTESSFWCYDQCSKMCSILYDLIENTLAESKHNLAQSRTPEV